MHRPFVALVPAAVLLIPLEVGAQRTAKPPPGPINAILFDRKHGTMWGGSSHHREDDGIAW